MNPGAVWWGQVGSALRFLNELGRIMESCQGAVLHMPPKLPWRGAFQEAAEQRCSALGGGRSIRCLSWDGETEPGAFLLGELCPPAVQANYWPGQSHAAYLAAHQELILNDWFVWVTGIHTRSSLARWTEFAAEYRRCAADPQSCAVFLLEYDGPPVSPPAQLAWLTCPLEDYDCRVFCLEAAAALNNTNLRPYQAELARAMGGGDPEFCAALLETGERLLRDPVAVAVETAARCLRQDGEPFPPLEENQAASGAWEAAVVLLFPAVERQRLAFIEAHADALRRYLPLPNPNGDDVAEPADLEIGMLVYLAMQPDFSVSREELEQLRLCRRVRNLLAHNRQVPYEDARRLIADG